MSTTISFKIRTIKHQIQACLRAIGNGLRSFIDRLVVLEAKLETLLEEKIMVQQPMKVQIKTGSEHHTTNWRSAMVRINGKPIYEVLKPLSKPEWEMVGNKGNHGKWCIAEYELPIGANIEFVAKANSQKPIEFSFTVGEVTSVDVEGFNYSSAICGWIVSI